MYVVDTPRTANPTTFMSNMLYACSVLYKSRLPLVLALNKVRGAPDGDNHYQYVLDDMCFGVYR